MNWRPHTEPGVERTSVLIALFDDEPDGEPFLAEGLFHWRNGKWVNEDSNIPLKHEKFIWLPESELFQTYNAALQPRCREAATSAGSACCAPRAGVPSGNC